MLHKFGSTRIGVWFIKRIVSPLDRWLYRRSDGKIGLSGRLTSPILLLTTTGRKSGQARTTPVFFLRDRQRIILCNVNPGFEQTNPWVLNLRANPAATIQIEAQTWECRAREANPAEVETYWPQLVRIWPAYQQHYDRSGKRAIFILEKTTPPESDHP